MPARRFLVEIACLPFVSFFSGSTDPVVVCRPVPILAVVFVDLQVSTVVDAF